MSRNLLANETSPYLLQHQNNPVHWRPWNSSVLDEAKETGKPILLSVGYAACHWCHVMAHESFEDPTIADLMNDLFINVKVDREERPDIDIIYQSALSLMGQQGGWPLTMFLTPDGHPFWGGTYFPPEPRYGRPGFPDILRRVAEVYRGDPETISTNVNALRDALSKLSRPNPGNGLNPEALDTVASQLLRLVDPIRGGLSGAPKFPQPVTFRFLWRAYKRTRASMIRDAVVLTLDSLCEGGIYDHVCGGFARYSTDDRWLAPHFEKMLYDNALLISLLTEVWLETQSPLYRRRVRETIAWALDAMRVDGPTSTRFAFASSFDADSEGVEGKFCVWTEAEIDALLGADAPLFKSVYDVSPGGNWESRTILNRSHLSAPIETAHEAILDRCLAILRGARAERVPPARDDKVLTDWNGLMIAALASTAAVFDNPDWLAAAETAFSFIVDNVEKDDRLFHSWKDGRARHLAVVDDYANMAEAALALHEATGKASYRDKAIAWTATADRFHWDTESGGYFLAASDTDDVIAQPKTISDNAVPAGNGTMVDVLARLFALTGNATYRERAEALIRLFSGDRPEYLVSIPGFLMGYEMLHRPVQVVLVGAPDDPASLALARAYFAAPVSTKILSWLAPGEALPASHPASGKTMVDGAPTAYVCVGPVCSLPATTPEALSQQLAQA